MSLVSKSITGLVQGMSQQTPMGRSANHLDLQVNAISSVLRGLGKRPGSYLAGVLGAATLDKSLWHLIDRDETERYVVKATSEGLSVWDLEGNAKTVSYTASAQSYLQCEDPQQDLRLLTVNDYTFVLNKTRQVNKSPKVDLNGDKYNINIEFLPPNTGWKFCVVVPRVVRSFRGTYLTTNLFTSEAQVFYFGTAQEAWTWYQTTYLGSLDFTVPHAPFTPEGGEQVLSAISRQLNDGTLLGSADDNVVGFSQSMDDYLSSVGETNVASGRLKLKLTAIKRPKYSPMVGFEYTSELWFRTYSGSWVEDNVQPVGFYAVRATDPNTVYPTPGVIESLKYEGYPFAEGLKDVGEPTSQNGLNVNGTLLMEPFGEYNDPEPSARAAYWSTRLTSEFPGYAFLMTGPGPEGGQLVSVQTNALTIKSLYKNFAKTYYQYIRPDDKLFIVIKQGVANQTYRVSVNGKLAEYTTGNTDEYETYKTEAIAENLKTDLATQGLDAKRYGRLVVVTLSDLEAELKFDFMDTWNSQAMYVMKNRVQAFTDLPSTFIEQHPVEVVGEGGTEGYYVRYTKSKLAEGTSTEPTQPNVVSIVVHGGWTAQEGRETGIWEECTARGLENYLDETTMPHALVRNADGTFTFKAIEWKPREVGDETTGAMPSFVGQSIKDVFFWRGRMGFLSNDSLVMSRSGEFFNLFPRTVKDVLDSDPIDIDVTVSKAANLLYAVPFNTSLLVFSTNGQYQVTANGVMTPKTIAVQPTLEYQVSGSLRPINMGEAVVFGSKRGEQLSLFETEVLPNQFLTSATDVTLHVPQLLPATINKVAPNNIGNMVVACDGTEKVYVYQYLWQGDNKVQEAWHYWTLPGLVRFVEFIDSKLYLIVEHDGYFKLLWIETKEYFKDITLNREVYKDLIEPSGAGVDYEMKIRLSPIYLRNQEGVPVPDAVLKLRNIVFHQSQGTTEYTVHVTPKQRSTKDHPFDPTREKHRVPVLGSSVDSVIEVTSQADAPCFFDGFTYEAEQVTRTRKI